jgi:hypothetical protein
MGKLIRRLIIGIALLLLIPYVYDGIANLVESDIPKEYQKLIDAGKAEVYDLDEEVVLENDTIHFMHFILTDQKSVLIYEVHKEEPGWSFPDGALKLKDKNGNEYFYKSGASSGKNSGEYHVQVFEDIPNHLSEIILDFDWYDRSFEVEIPLDKEGV